MSGSQKYGRGHLTIEDGGQTRRAFRLRTREEVELDDRMRRRFMRCVGADGTVPSRAVQEIREGRQAPWRKSARRVIEMRDAGVPATEIKAAAVGEFAEWVDEVLAHSPKRAA